MFNVGLIEAAIYETMMLNKVISSKAMARYCKAEAMDCNTFVCHLY